MKKLLLIMGDLATGKSTFANMLSKRYDTVLFCKDTIKETLGNTFGFSNRAENLKLSHGTAELMYLILAEFGKVNQALILESNFHTAELERMHEIALEHDYEVLTLVLRGNVEILHKRYLNRMYHENRHPVHLSTTIDVFEDFKSCIESLRSEQIPGRTLSIQADNFAYQTNEEILSKIDAFMRD